MASEPHEKQQPKEVKYNNGSKEQIITMVSKSKHNNLPHHNKQYFIQRLTLNFVLAKITNSETDFMKTFSFSLTIS